MNIKISVLITYVSFKKEIDKDHKDHIVGDLNYFRTNYFAEKDIELKIHDKNQIPVGTEVPKWFEEKLNSSDVIIPLLNRDFIISTQAQSFQKEFKDIVKRHLNKRVTVMPIILSSCLWKHSPFKHLQKLPRENDTLFACPDKADAITKITEDIKIAIEEIAQKKHKGRIGNKHPLNKPGASHDLFNRDNNLTKFLKTYLDLTEGQLGFNFLSPN